MQQFPRGSPMAASSPQDIIIRSGSNWQGKEGGGRRKGGRGRRKGGRGRRKGGRGRGGRGKEGRERGGGRDRGGRGGRAGGEERGEEKKKTEHIRHSSLIQIEFKSQTENQLSIGLRRMATTSQCGGEPWYNCAMCSYAGKVATGRVQCGRSQPHTTQSESASRVFKPVLLPPLPL